MLRLVLSRVRFLTVCFVVFAFSGISFSQEDGMCLQLREAIAIGEQNNASVGHLQSSLRDLGCSLEEASDVQSPDVEETLLEDAPMQGAPTDESSPSDSTQATDAFNSNGSNAEEGGVSDNQPNAPLPEDQLAVRVEELLSENQDIRLALDKGNEARFKMLVVLKELFEQQFIVAYQETGVSVCTEPVVRIANTSAGAESFRVEGQVNTDQQIEELKSRLSDFALEVNFRLDVVGGGVGCPSPFGEHNTILFDLGSAVPVFDRSMAIENYENLPLISDCSRLGDLVETLPELEQYRQVVSVQDRGIWAQRDETIVACLWNPDGYYGNFSPKRTALYLLVLTKGSGE